MKKVFCLLLAVTVLCTVFSSILHRIRTTNPDKDTSALLLDYITPVIAYADSDTIGSPGLEPPPPPPFD